MQLKHKFLALMFKASLNSTNNPANKLQTLNQELNEVQNNQFKYE
jgi:hypothetical protein